MGEVVSKEFYDDIKKIINESRNNVRNYVNTTILFAYWNIGKKIVEFQGGEEKAKYGDKVISELSKQMTHDFGKVIFHSFTSLLAATFAAAAVIDS